MLPDDMENYLFQISRVLKKNNNCLITFFLINDKSRKLMNESLSSRNFQFRLDGFYTTYDKEPEVAIGYDEQHIIDSFNKHGLEIKKVLYGSWCGRKKYLSYQDIIIAKKN
jgi:hypothetical protein